MTTEPIFTAANVGCYLDGHLGWHNTYRVIELAVWHGWELTPEDEAYVDAYEAQDDSMVSPQSGDVIGLPEISEAVTEISRDATDYLQSVTAPGLVWEWDAGELSLVQYDDDES